MSPIYVFECIKCSYQQDYWGNLHELEEEPQYCDGCGKLTPHDRVWTVTGVGIVGKAGFSPARSSK